MEGKGAETPFATSRGCLTLMTSSSADLHSVESETSTTDPSSCTATTLTGTDTVLPVRMAVLRTSVSCMHTHKRGVGVREAKKPGNDAGQSGEPGRGATLPRTLPLSCCTRPFHSFPSQKLHLDHKVLLLTNIWISSFGAHVQVWLLWR